MTEAYFPSKRASSHHGLLASRTDFLSTGIQQPVITWVFCLLGVLCIPAAAQNSAVENDVEIITPSTTGGAGSQPKAENGRPRNAYADTLRPQVKRTPTLLNQPYQPIKAIDDQAQIPEIEMFVGESRVFPAPGVARIAVGNGQIMTAAALDAKEVLIFANGVGTSSLFIWNEDGRYQRVKINIVQGDTTRVAREIAAFLTAIPNARASVVGDNVIVEGDNLSTADLKKIAILGKRYPQIVNFTSDIGWEPMVLMDVKVVEFPRSELREIGLKWQATGGAAVGAIWGPGRRGNDGPYQIDIQTGQDNAPPITNPDSASGVFIPSSLNVLSVANLGLNAQLALLEQDGKASILAEPQLSARSGAEASFLAGGEFPYSVTTLNGVNVQFKKYGITLDIKPNVDRNGVIRATITAEVSSIDPSVSTPSGPALLTRRTDTEFNVRDGETIVLAGLLQRDSSTDIQKVPLLGDIPVLGALFRSKRFQDRQTELVVFVTPTVVDSKSRGLVERVKRTTERLMDHFGGDPYLPGPHQSGESPAALMSAASGENAKTVDSGKVVPSAGDVEQDAGMEGVERPLTLGGSMLKVRKEDLALYESADAGSTVLLRLGEGALVQLGSGELRETGGRLWRNVVVGELNGWVDADAVEPARRLQFVQPDLTSHSTRADQGGAGLPLSSGAKGQGVLAAGAKQVTPVGPGNGDSNTVTPRRFRVALERAAMRVTPDVNAPVVQALSQGQIVEALPQAPSKQWIAVEAGGVRGWVAGQWLEPVSD